MRHLASPIETLWLIQKHLHLHTLSLALSLSLPREACNLDLCLPLLVGVLRDDPDQDSDQRSQDTEVFVRVRTERSRLELDSLTSVQSTEARWTHGDDVKLPAVELQFDYISKEKQKRRYVLLDHHPQEALQSLMEVLRTVVEQNQRLILGLGHVRLQCLRCGLDFSSQLDQSGDQCEPRPRTNRRLGSAVVLGEDGQEEDDDRDGEQSMDTAEDFNILGTHLQSGRRIRHFTWHRFTWQRRIDVRAEPEV
ncbi:hypothetical protein WMY93_022235 [Mugilogobius chulae]|uniref:Serine/threonine-protein kinase 11-interacting protein PH domain-containing protein n=1 Tax=Mugilogobius chulae TaxID=88201 RepID=A0AAW0N7I5_9GOBI